MGKTSAPLLFSDEIMRAYLTLNLHQSQATFACGAHASKHKHRIRSSKQIGRYTTAQSSPNDLGISRRELHLRSVGAFLLADVSIGDNDATTLVNSILGAYGLPKLKTSLSFREYEDFDIGFYFEYPRAWVKRTNHLRPGLYVSDFNTSDKAVLEIYPEEPDTSLAMQIVSHFVNPGQEVGGDSRLLMPSARRIKAGTSDKDGQMYTYVTFPSETVTRSGYQIQRKNFGVTAVKKGMAYSLVVSARTDQYNKEKEDILQHIVASFRLQP